MTDPTSVVRLSPDFAEALAFTATLHNGQMRKSCRIPYIAHLLAVSALVLENDGTEDEAIAALLHDALEDQAPETGGAEVLAERIRRRFGSAVLEIVQACTDSVTFPKPEWRPRKEAYIARLAAKPESALIVVAADKLHNARSILHDLVHHGDAVWDIFNGPREGTLWYYRSLAEIIPARLTGRGRLLGVELARTVSELDRRGSRA